MKTAREKHSFKILFSTIFVVISVVATILGLATDSLTIFERFFQKTPVPKLDLFTETFPFFVGQRWAYSFAIETETGGTEILSFTETVDMVTTGADEAVRIYRVQQEGDILDMYCGGWSLKPGSSTIWYITDDERVYIACTDDEANDIAIALFAEQPDFENNNLLNTPDYMLPLAEEKIWPAFVDLPAREDKMYQWYTANQTVLQVPAGNYEGCYQVVLMTLPDSSTRYICPGIGLAAAEYRHHGSMVNYRLELTSVSMGD